MKHNTPPFFNYTGEHDFDVSTYRSEIDTHGIFLAQFAQPIDLLALIHKIGRPHSHNASNAYIWDIRPQPNATSETVARSQTTEEFVFHTDCSFEVPPPTYVALYVIHEDRYGGGVSSMLDWKAIASRLDAATKEILRQNFKIKIPKEFMKDSAYSLGPIIFGDDQISYRRECIVESELSPEQVRALDTLDKYIADCSSIHSLLLPRHSILFLDNTRYLHARTMIEDEKRHLQRIRYF